MPQSSTIPIDNSDQVIVHVETFDPTISVNSTVVSIPTVTATLTGTNNVSVVNTPTVNAAITSSPTLNVNVLSLPSAASGTILNGSSHTNSATVITVPTGVTWTGSVALTGTLNSILAGATAFPNASYGGVAILEMGLSTPAVLALVAPSVSSVTLPNISLAGPGTLTLNFNTATAASASAVGRYQ